MATQGANPQQSKYSEQYMMNSSFDELYGVLASILVAEFSGTLKRLQADTDGNLKVNVAAGGTSGTQYTEGDTDASITGNALMWEDTGDTLRATSAAKPLPVEIIAGGGSGGTSAADDADFTAGTTAGTPAMGVYESSPTNVTDGDLGTVGITQGRRLKTSATIDAALPAGTNAIGKLAANSGVDIGDVDILSIAAGTNNIGDVDIASIAAGDNNIGNVDIVSGTITTVSALGNGTTGPQKAEDVASADGDIGIPAMAIRDDTLNIRSGTEGDYEFLHTDANGALWTHDDILEAAISGSEMQVDVVGALPAGTNAIGKLAANSGVDIGDVDVTSISAGTNAIGNVGLIGRTSGGLSIFRSIDLDESEEEVKASAGQVFTITAFNRTAAPLYLKLYNATAANVTVGSTTPVMTFVVPGNADSDGAGFIHTTEIGYAFGTAICAAVTTGVADADTGAPGANDCVVNIGYV